MNRKAEKKLRKCRNEKKENTTKKCFESLRFVGGKILEERIILFENKRAIQSVEISQRIC